MEPLQLREKRETFFKLVFGNNKGIVCLAFLDDKRKFREEFFTYPEQLGQMLGTVETELYKNNVYFCPQLLREKKRLKENVELTPNAWADLDSCHPDNLLVPPSITIESSPGRWQAYWLFDKPVDPDDAEDLSRRIAYQHAEQGADRSGWDLTQLLRVPFTYNYKYKSTTDTPMVLITEAAKRLYRMSDFNEYPENPEYSSTDVPMPDTAALDSGDDILQLHRMTLNPLIWRLFQEIPEEGKWSDVLWNLQMLLFESGFTREQVFMICIEAKCNKYARDGKPVRLLWKEVCRAEARASVHTRLIVQNDERESLLTTEEAMRIAALPQTFVERYIEWASSLGDAAPQYHQAGAFVILSSLLSGSIKLPTSYGTVIPNLWFMILADTTLTRKSTAMDIAMDLAMEIDDDILMATDGSLEGMLSSLSARPGKPSVFLRDEFSGLLEQMTKKDYMAGMPELLTKLYDGKMQKRILRKEVIEVRDPRLIFFAGGIKNKVTSLIGVEQVSSGFMPRFIFITAESDISKLRPIGPPTVQIIGNKNAILDELRDAVEFYNRTQIMHIEKLKTNIEQKIVYEAELTDEAWVRYNQLESTLLEVGLRSDKPEVMTPIGDRLAKSILKCALLIAAVRQREDIIEVTLEDLLRAIHYGDDWFTYVYELMQHVGKGKLEREIDLVFKAIQRSGQEGAARSKLMQSYHLSAREANDMFRTLEERGLITRQKAGRTEIFLPTTTEVYA